MVTQGLAGLSGPAARGFHLLYHFSFFFIFLPPCRGDMGVILSRLLAGAPRSVEAVLRGHAGRRGVLSFHYGVPASNVDCLA